MSNGLCNVNPGGLSDGSFLDVFICASRKSGKYELLREPGRLYSSRRWLDGSQSREELITPLYVNLSRKKGRI